MPPTNYSYTRSYSLNVLLLCNDSFWSHDIYCICPSWRGILLCCSPEGFFPFFTMKGFFLFVGSVSWSDVRSWDRDVILCIDCKARWGKFVICDKINWTEWFPPTCFLSTGVHPSGPGKPCFSFHFLVGHAKTNIALLDLAGSQHVPRLRLGSSGHLQSPTSSRA